MSTQAPALCHLGYRGPELTVFPTSLIQSKNTIVWEAYSPRDQNFLLSSGRGVTELMETQFLKATTPPPSCLFSEKQQKEEADTVES